MYQTVLKILLKNARKNVKTFTGVRFALMYRKVFGQLMHFRFNRKSADIL